MQPTSDTNIVEWIKITLGTKVHRVKCYISNITMHIFFLFRSNYMYLVSLLNVAILLFYDSVIQMMLNRYTFCSSVLLLPPAS